MAGFTVTLDKNLYAMERDKPLEIKATVVRLHGHKDNLAFTIPGLPAGITLTSPETVPEKGGEVILKLEAKPDAPAASLSLRVLATEKKAEGDTAKPVEKTAIFSFKDDKPPRPLRPRRNRRHLAHPPPRERGEKGRSEREKRRETKVRANRRPRPQQRDHDFFNDRIGFQREATAHGHWSRDDWMTRAPRCQVK